VWFGVFLNFFVSQKMLSFKFLTNSLAVYIKNEIINHFNSDLILTTFISLKKKTYSFTCFFVFLSFHNITEMQSC
jgi:hypothetical protein